MKRTQKALSLALILCMLLGMALATVLTAFAETSTPATPPVTQWVNNEGKPLNKSYSYDEDIPKYIEFLQTGLENYKKEK